MNLHLRQTGRTTRMLAQAAAYAAQGRAVYVYGHHPHYVRLMQRDFGTGFPSVKFEVLPEDWDWVCMQPGGQRAHPNCVFLVDHLAIELRLEELDKQLMKMQQLVRQLYALTT